LKQKGKALEVDVASGVDTKVLMTSYVENNTSQDKDWIFDLVVLFMYIPRSGYSTTP